MFKLIIYTPQKKKTSFSGLKNIRQRLIDQSRMRRLRFAGVRGGSVWEIVRRTASMTRRGRKSACPASGDPGLGARMTRIGPIFPAAAAAKQKRRASAAALGKKPRSVNYFGPITAHNEGPGEPRNTSSCCGISPLARPTGRRGLRWENARG